jgi:YD repeat-containing protein
MLGASTSLTPESGTTSYTYNADGTLQRKTDAKGQKVEYGYDGLKRVTSINRIAAG